MEISLTELAGMFQRAPKTHSLTVGEAVFIRTVTLYYTGRIKAITDSDILLSDAAWIADMGARFADSIKDGTLGEVEPFLDDATVNRDVVIDITKWKHPLPRDQK